MSYKGEGNHKAWSAPNTHNFQKKQFYQHMLERCISMLKYDKKDCEFYLADSKGVPIWTANVISMDDDEGEGEIPGTLMNFIRHRFPSKVNCTALKR